LQTLAEIAETRYKSRPSWAFCPHLPMIIALILLALPAVGYCALVAAFMRKR
jgi:hypothetical protein